MFAPVMYHEYAQAMYVPTAVPVIAYQADYATYNLAQAYPVAQPIAPEHAAEVPYVPPAKQDI